MQMPKDFQTAQGFGDYTPLPAGGYICRIMRVEETKSKSGRDMIKVSLDIAEGDFRNHFAESWKADTRPDRKWGCVANQLVYDTTDGTSTNKGFKSFCTAAEESNPGFTIQWGNAFEGCFNNRLIGVVFGREEYVGTDGKSHWATKPKFFRSVESIRKGDFKTPEDKPVQASPAASYGGYGGYPAPAPAADPFALPPAPAPVAQQKPQTVPGLADFTEIVPDGNLPF